MIHILLTNAALLAAVMLILWAIAVRIRDVSFIDSFWAFGMVVMAASTYVQTSGSAHRTALILGLTALWGLRLATHLFLRWRTDGEDPRYKRIIGGAMETKGWSFAKASLLLVFLTQAPLLFIVCLPAQMGMLAADPVETGWLAFAGKCVALIGIGFETIGDWQLGAFRKDSASVGKVLDTGLWRYTRHPNYFGDACTWWGIWMIAAETVPGRYAVIGPILLTWTLMKWSGMPLLERGMRKRRPGYDDYVRRTSGFVPWWPRGDISVK